MISYTVLYNACAELIVFTQYRTVTCTYNSEICIIVFQKLLALWYVAPALFILFFAFLTSSISFSFDVVTEKCKRLIFASNSSVLCFFNLETKVLPRKKALKTFVKRSSQRHWGPKIIIRRSAMLIWEPLCHGVYELACFLPTFVVWSFVCLRK